MTHTCPGSKSIATMVTDQCDDDPEIAAGVLLFAAAIAGIRANMTMGDLAHQLLRCSRAAESITGQTWRSVS